MSDATVTAPTPKNAHLWVQSVPTTVQIADPDARPSVNRYGPKEKVTRYQFSKMTLGCALEALHA